jgi:hypothetical protein
LCRRLCLWGLFLGACAFPFPIRFVSTGPIWSEQVAAWHHNHDYPLRVWPKTWTADLSDRDLPCPARDSVAAGPSYCENGWLHRVRADGALAVELAKQKRARGF